MSRRETKDESERAMELARVGQFLARLQDESYYGTVTVQIVNGRFTSVRTEQVLKVDELEVG